MSAPSTGRAAKVELIGVRKEYDGGVVAVHDTTLTIDAGEFVVLVGPSGCGKSTTLRMVAGLETISAGELRIGGKVVNDTPPADRDIAMVFQTYALYPHMTARENMAFALRLRKRPQSEIAERVDAAADTLGITNLLDRLPKHLSGGQRQRVAIGRAIVREPSVFLFDEPLSNLDAALRGEMRRELAALHHRLAATMLYVTHDQVEAMTLGDRIVVMNKGHVVQVGAPTDVYQNPRDMFVAGFVGSPPMNLLRASVARRDGKPELRLDGSADALPLPLALSKLVAGSSLESVVVGIRPEDVKAAVVTDGDASGGAMVGVVELAELMGHQQLLHVRVGSQSMTVRSEARDRLGVASRVTLSIDPARMLLFDPRTTLALDAAP